MKRVETCKVFRIVHSIQWALNKKLAFCSFLLFSFLLYHQTLSNIDCTRSWVPLKVSCPKSESAVCFYIYIFYFFLAVLGLLFRARAFSSCGKWGPLFIAVRGPLTIVASLVEEHRLQTRRLSSCGSRAQLLRGMWDLPRPGLEPASPALAGRFSTTAPPGKPCFYILFNFSRQFVSLFLFFFAIIVSVCLQSVFKDPS